MPRTRWNLVGGGCLTLFLLMLGAGMAWWQYVSYVPPVPARVVMMPVPNARDDFRAAIQLLPGSGNWSPFSPPPAGTGSGKFPPPPPAAQTIRARLKVSAPALKRFRVGLTHEFARQPAQSMVEATVNAAQDFPEFARYRELARLLADEATLARSEGRGRDALRSGLDAVKLGEMLQRNTELMPSLVGIAAEAIGLRAVEESIATANGKACADAAAELWKLDISAGGFATTLEAESASTLYTLTDTLRHLNPGEMAQALSQNSGAPPSSSDLGVMVRFIVTPKRNIVRDYKRYVDARIARARLPFFERGARPPPPSDPITAMFAPELEYADFKWDQQQATRRILATRLAIRAHASAQGHSPVRLEQLVPQYLPAIPQDPFAPKPLVYRLIGSKQTLYSRGPDGDDDNGRDLGSRIRPNADGDLASTRRPAGGVTSSTGR